MLLPVTAFYSHVFASIFSVLHQIYFEEIEPLTRFYSGCAKMRPVEDFSINKKDALRKTCNRHSKKRAIQSFNQWDNFIGEIDS